MCARKIMSSHFLYNFGRRTHGVLPHTAGGEGWKGGGVELGDWGALHSSQAAFISLAFYGHKNFIIIFNNLGKHIAASAVANQSFSTVFLCLLSEPHPPPSSCSCSCSFLFITWHIRTPGISGSIYAADSSGRRTKYGRTRNTDSGAQ